MRISDNLQRVIFTLCSLFFLEGCSSPTCRQWALQSITVTCPSFNGGRLLLESDAAHPYFQLELVRNLSGLRLYLNLLLYHAQPCNEDPQRTAVNVVFEGEEEPWKVYPYLMEGGQKLLFPGDVADYLIQKLLNDEDFVLEMGHQRFEVVSEKFISLYQNLLSLPIVEKQGDCEDIAY